MEQWAKIEDNVNEAEKAKRNAQKASRILYSETSIPKIGSNIEDKDGAGGEMVKKYIAGRDEITEKDLLEKSKRKRVASTALAREKFFDSEAKKFLGEEGSSERVLVSLRKDNLSKALRFAWALQKQREKLLNEEAEILKTMEGEPTGAELEVLGEIRGELAENSELGEKLLEENPEAYFGLHLKQLKEYKKELTVGKIVETDYVKKEAEDIVKNLLAGKPVLIYGHLGSGKTELAMHIAKKYIGKEALVISGSKNTNQSELYGHQILNINEIKKADLDLFEKEVENKFKVWCAENLKVDENEKNRAHDRILQIYLTQFKSGTVSDFFLGPIYRAMEEGRPIIIDEVNAIPHEVLISLNHILTRRVGDKVNVQQNSGSSVEVGAGFGIMMTGNLNQGQETYVDRQDMDPAFLSRLHKLEYDYLPQSVEGLLEESGKEDELFQLILAEIMDRVGNIEAPEDSIKKIWNLSKAARITQNVFSGKEVSSAFYFQEAGGRPMKYLLKENLLSMRALENIIGQWKSEGYAQELDYYIWNNFIREGTIASDRAYLYQLFKDQFGFFKSDGWEQNPDYGSGGNINSFDVNSPKNKPENIKFFGPREVVEFAFGKAPERAKWPEIKPKNNEQDEKFEVEIDLEKIMKVEKLYKEIAETVGRYEALEVENKDKKNDQNRAKPKNAQPKVSKKKKFGIF